MAIFRERVASFIPRLDEAGLVANVGMDRKAKQAFALTPEYFGPLWPYVMNDNITDIDFNGSQLWVTDCSNCRIQVVSHQITESFIEQFSQRIANQVSRQFNKLNNLLEAEANNLRISIIHESAAVSGRSLCIRKSLPLARIVPAQAIAQNYCSEQVMGLLVNCIRAKMNIVFCGEPGVGKTECAKFFSGFIPADERVITIEDTLEWHFHDIHPEKDCVELKVSENFSYTKAIKTCLRQNPKWIMLSEARSTEVKYLLECWSTGVHGLTTLHTDDTRKVPDRILNMLENRIDADRLENDVYTFMDVAVLLRRKYIQSEKVTLRYIDQVCFFSREQGMNIQRLVVTDGRLSEERFPEDILTRMSREGIGNPFVSKELSALLEREVPCGT